MTSPATVPLDGYGTSRASRLASDGRFLVHADLHNHSHFSDGAGDPELAFASLRDSGLDVAALTDHAFVASAVKDLVDLPFLTRLTGLDRAAWDRVAELADAADEPGRFVALRGFEWSSTVRGHINVWGTPGFIDPLRTLGWSAAPLYRWLRSARGRDGLASFNHPGGRLDRSVFRGFRPYPAAREQFVGFEVFNKRDDYLFTWTEEQRPSPLVLCLDQGWRPGLIGNSDEHGTDWGQPEGKGRTGLWVDELSRAGVFAALRARRAFATRVKGLRLDATVDGVRMGGVLPPPSTAGRVLRIDVDRGTPWHGRPLVVQLLSPGRPLPALVVRREVAIPTPDQPVLELAVPPSDAPWLVLRLADPAVPADARARGSWADDGAAVAYASPWWT